MNKLVCVNQTKIIFYFKLIKCRKSLVIMVLCVYPMLAMLLTIQVDYLLFRAGLAITNLDTEYLYPTIFIPRPCFVMK